MDTVAFLEKYKLSTIEYKVAEYVEKHSFVNGWCNTTKKQIAKELNVNIVYTFTMISRLIQKGLLRKNKFSKHLQVTELWYQEQDRETPSN